MLTFDEPRKRRTVSLTPLIDVVFLLLIFFMLTSSFLQTQALSIFTPSPSEQEQLPEDISVVEVWLEGDGGLAVDGEAVTLAELKPAIAAAIDGREDMTVSILAEPGARTQALISAIEAARDAGAADVGTARVEELRR